MPTMFHRADKPVGQLVITRDTSNNLARHCNLPRTIDPEGHRWQVIAVYTDSMGFVWYTVQRRDNGERKVIAPRDMQNLY
jgi:hypothetical protein